MRGSAILISSGSTFSQRPASDLNGVAWLHGGRRPARRRLAGSSGGQAGDQRRPDPDGWRLYRWLMRLPTVPGRRPATRGIRG